jgi:hypothetical protein
MDTPNSIRSDALFEKLVPDEGPSDTVEGEMIRAISRIGYRYFNDGDYFYRGYGCETAGPSHAYLVKYSPIGSELRKIFKGALGKIDEEYEAILDNAVGLIVDYVEGRNGNYKPNTRDMLACESIYKDSREEDDGD